MFQSWVFDEMNEFAYSCFMGGNDSFIWSSLLLLIVVVFCLLVLTFMCFNLYLERERTSFARVFFFFFF